MSLLDLSKEQKQYLVLGAIAVVILIILIVFGVKVSLSSISTSREELQGLTEKIEAADKTVSKNQLAKAELRSTISELEAHLANIPPDRNYYSWATEIIFNEARRVHFDIDAIDEVVIAAPSGNPKAQGEVKLESYSLRINAHGGYENIKSFLNRIADNHPLVRVTGIEISTGSEPDVHNVQLFIEWPFNLGYITEAWKSITVNPPLNDNPAARSPSQPDEPAADSGSGSGPAEQLKKPVPPPPRPVHAAPGSTDGSRQPDTPVAGENSTIAGEHHDKPYE